VLRDVAGKVNGETRTDILKVVAILTDRAQRCSNTQTSKLRSGANPPPIRKALANLILVQTTTATKVAALTDTWQNLGCTPSRSCKIAAA
jgi:hypothetical protein